ncbi:LysR family transcriptional regulator [Raoultella ornithinolytica]|uniref:LysR family transcriptional regulator n=1 Tax=Raoultella ornithinolytica TaxID=54291 RepID=UPI000FEB708E|nr:LysR substrate-binding domain-containing protein [Raoultella ornithinolytica]RWT96129.1 LysR family transcriptional regulator [Raoultella ornithinolytica]
MKPLLDVLVILDALEKEGSFAAASAKLYKTPSALSYTIHKLESDLNIQLLDRSGHRARFTPNGQMLLEKGREVLHTVRELEKQAIKLHQGWENALVLAVDNTFPFFLLAPLVSRFYQQHTAARLRFVRDTPASGWSALVEGRADIVVGVLSDPPALVGYGFSPLGELAHIFVIAPQHPLAKMDAPLSWRAMKHYRAIVSGGEWPPVDDQESLVTYDFAGQLMLISAGLGWGYVPRYLVQDQLESGELIEKEVASHLPAHRAWLGWNEDAAGLSCAWWRSEILANNAIHTIYDIKIV